MAGIFGLLMSGAGVLKDQYFNLTSLLLPGNGTNGAQNNTFLDSSTNNFTITRNGDTTQGTFSPFSQTGWGNYFNGTNAYLSMTSTSAIQLDNATAFTIEFWVNPSFIPAVGTPAMIYRAYNNSSPFQGYGIGIGANTLNTNLQWWDGTSWSDIGSVSANTWTHVAISYEGSGTTRRFFINGVLQGSAGTIPSSINYTSGTYQLGARNADQYLTGYLSNFRIVKGTALYTNNFTPSITPLTAVSGTSLLTCKSNRFVDNSSTPITLTVNGTPSVTPFSPFAPTSSYSAAAVGGSGYFDGSGDYLSVADSSAFTLGTNAFTAEAWVYPTTSGTSRMILGQYEDADNTGSFLLYLNTGNKLVCIIPALSITIAGATNVPANAWSHVVITRSGSSFAIFLNGSRDASPATNSGSLTDSTYAFTFGADRDGNNLLYTGYIASARLVNGTAVYDPTQTSITVPTAPLTAITNTSLLLNFTNAGVVDVTAKNVLETEGNAQISTAQSKWGGGSIAFDGTGDYLLTNGSVTDLLAFGTGDFCIEMWVYFNSLSGTPSLLDARPASTNGAYVFLYASSSGIDLFLNGAVRISGTVSLSTGVWYHVAIARSGGSTRIYVAGNQVGSTYSDTTSYLGAAGRPAIGTSGSVLGNDALNGYIDDLRITKGNARGYTGSTITVPSGPFPQQ